MVKNAILVQSKKKRVHIYIKNDGWQRNIKNKMFFIWLSEKMENITEKHDESLSLDYLIYLIILLSYVTDAEKKKIQFI